MSENVTSSSMYFQTMTALNQSTPAIRYLTKEEENNYVHLVLGAVFIWMLFIVILLMIRAIGGPQLCSSYDDSFPSELVQDAGLEVISRKYRLRILHDMLASISYPYHSEICCDGNPVEQGPRKIESNRKDSSTSTNTTADQSAQAVDSTFEGERREGSKPSEIMQEGINERIRAGEQPIMLCETGATNLEPDEERCGVCLLTFDEEDEVTKGTSCCHLFHHECEKTWIEGHDRCPRCRYFLVSPQEFKEAAIYSMGEGWVQGMTDMGRLSHDEFIIMLSPPSYEIESETGFTTKDDCSTSSISNEDQPPPA